MGASERRISMQLYNTLTGRKERFEPADPKRPTMYVCGPTVYNHPHIGNARPAVVFDLLFRLLRHRYGDALYVRNVTDIDDKIMAAAAAEGVRAEVVAARYAAAYQDDMAALNVLPPTVEPYATGHVPQMIAMIQRLSDGGHAYVAEGHVLFHVPSFAAYGALSRRSREEMIEGARVEVAPYKRDPADFVLWKPSTDEQPGWDSPWGRGRPGWHIECSAMVEAHLGATVDIHGGGLDLKFPHHENEVAQSVCAHAGAPLARFWLHNGFLDVEREKMSKSLGNVVLVRDLLHDAPGEAIRYALLAAHYRKPLDWSAAGLARAKHALDRLYLTLSELPGPNEPEPEFESGALPEEVEHRSDARKSNDSAPPPDFEPAAEREARGPVCKAAVPAGVLAALEDDLNTPKAFAELFALARAANASADEDERRELKSRLLTGGSLLGLLQQDPEVWLKTSGRSSVSADLRLRWNVQGATKINHKEIERLIELRAAARKAKDFAEADRIRDQLAAEGVILEDQPGRTRWRLAG
jgi:cysteinyl-tRNA synthetase